MPANKGPRRSGRLTLLRAGVVAVTCLSWLLPNVGVALAAPANDNFADSENVSTFPASSTGSSSGATLESGEPAPTCASIGASVWYRINTATSSRFGVNTFGSSTKFDTVLAVYTGSSLNSLTQVACNDDVEGSVQSRLTFTAQANQDFFVQLAGFSGASGAFKLTIETAGPVNDMFSDALEVVSVPFTDDADTGLATTQTGEPVACVPIGKTLWYRFTASSASDLSLDTFASNFDTVLAVYTGTSLGDLDPVACNDDSGSQSGFLQSQVRFAAFAGQTFHVQAGGFGQASGDLHLSLATTPLPPNDNFANAEVISAIPATRTQDTSFASLEAGEPEPQCDLFPSPVPIGASVWYRYTANSPGLLTADTFDSDFDTVLAVYTGSSVSNLSQDPASCSDQFLFFSNQSQVSFLAQAGVTYFFQVSGFFGDTGNLTFHLQGAGAA